MLGRRLLALIVAVLCIVVRVGAGAGWAPVDEAKALGGPGLVGRTAPDVASEPEGSDAPDGLIHASSVSGGLASVALLGPWRASGLPGLTRARRGDPKASRGPPSFVVS